MVLSDEYKETQAYWEAALGQAVYFQIAHGERNGSAFHVVIDVKDGVVGAPRIVWAEQK